jgi:hypothetical protein
MYGSLVPAICCVSPLAGLALAVLLFLLLWKQDSQNRRSRTVTDDLHRSHRHSRTPESATTKSASEYRATYANPDRYLTRASSPWAGLRL